MPIGPAMSHRNSIIERSGTIIACNFGVPDFDFPISLGRLVALEEGTT